MRHSAELNLIIECLREYEFLFETALAHESGDQGVLFAEKKPRVENLVILSICHQFKPFIWTL
jgi:hypothetical protein